MLLGAHVSIAGGIDKAIGRGEAIGAHCIQTFASSPRTLAFSPIAEEVVAAYTHARQHSAIQLHVFHGIYLINLASEKPDYVAVSTQSLIHYQHLAAQLHVLGTVFHIGSHKGAGFDQVKTQIAQAICTVLQETEPGTFLLVENAAGHAGTVGQTIDELATVFETVSILGGDMSKLGLCLDTQHAFASGVDPRTETGLADFLNMVETKIGLSYIKVIHTNDSKVDCASHKDRHENIGAGIIGPDGLRRWLTHPKLAHLPFILEVPGVDGDGPGKKDIDALKQLV
jgi:deoxyribonuclease-4